MQRLVVAFTVVILLLGISFGVLSATITVPDDYPTIQAAIDAAQPGDTVYVKAGRYMENLVIDKPLSLVGEDRTTTIIRSPNSEQDVITVELAQGEIRIEGVKISGGYAGIYMHVFAGAQVTLNDVIVSENRFGVATFGDGSLVVTGSYFVDNDSIGLQLGNATAVVESNEIIRGGTGLLLVGSVDAALDNNLIALCEWGIDTCTTGCGWADGEEFFSGTVAGTGNQVYVWNTDLFPRYPGVPWPEGFIDQAWYDTIGKATDALNRSSALDDDQDYLGAVNAYSAGMVVLKDAPFTLLEAYSHQDIGGVYGYLGRYEAALAAYQSARAVFVERGMEIDVTDVDVNIGVVYGYLGRYEEALAAYQSARAVYVKQEMEVGIADVDVNIGVIYRHLGRYEEALVAYQSARAVYVKQEMEVGIADVDGNIGVVYENFGRYEEALAKFEAARAVYVKQEMEVGIADVDGNIGMVYDDLGRYEDALAKFEAARAVYVKQEMTVDVARIDQNIGVVYENLGRYEEALKAYEEALVLLDETPPLPRMEYSYPATRWGILENKGICYERLGKWNQAREAYEDSIAVIESLRGYLKSEELKTTWQERTKDVYERLIDLLFRMGEGASAFTYAERCRARTFLDLLAMGPVGTIENVAEEGIRSGVVEPSAIEADVDEVVRSLPSNTAALQYFVTADATYVWVIYQGKIQGPIQLKHGRAELMHKVIETREQLGSGPEHPFNPRNLVELYDWLIRPVENLLPKTTGDGDVPHLIIIPSGPLYYLPFQALIWTSEDLTENAPLIVRYALSYSPSLATLKYAQALADTAYPQATFLAIADPDSGDPRLPDAQTEARMVAQLFTVSSVYVDSDATEDVVQSDSATAHEILLSTHGLFNPHNPMFSYLVVSPTDRNSDGKLYAYEVFSLPLHANMVVLSACETLLPSIEDMKGQIKAVRGADDDTPVELTDDQLEALTAGDEVVGLTRAFISAGASSVLSSLWSVPSGATSQLMVSLYKHIKDNGMDKAQALRVAQLEVMNTIGCTQPYFWAAFNLMGDWR